MLGIPKTDQHKVVGFFAGLLVAAAARYGFNVPLEVAIILLNGVLLLVSTVVAKYTNPTGANTSTDKVIMEAVVEEVKQTSEMRVP